MTKSIGADILWGLFYLAANLKEADFVFVAVDFDVTTTDAVHNTPGVNPVIVIVLSAVTPLTEFVNTVELSTSFVTVTLIFTPADGNVELTLTTIGWDVPTTPRIFPVPGSTFTEKATAASVGVGVGVGVGEGLSPPLLHENAINVTPSNNNLILFIYCNLIILSRMFKLSKPTLYLKT